MRLEELERRQTDEMARHFTGWCIRTMPEDLEGPTSGWDKTLEYQGLRFRHSVEILAWHFTFRPLNWLSRRR